MRLLVHEPMNTRSSCERLHRLAGLQIHVFERLAAALRSIVGAELGRIGHALDDRHDLAGIGAPGDLRRDVGGVVDFDAVVFRAGIAGQLLPARDGGVEIFSLGANSRPCTYSNVVSSGAIMPARAPASIDMLQTVIRSSIEKPRITLPVYSMHVAGAAVGADLADQIQNHVLGRDAAAELAIDAQLERFGLRLQQRLRGQHVLDFAGADAERQRAEARRAWRCGCRRRRSSCPAA